MPAKTSIPTKGEAHAPAAEGVVPQEITPRARLAALCATLPKYYNWRILLEQVFASDPFALATAYAQGDLPPAVQHILEDTCPPRKLECWLLGLLIRRGTGSTGSLSKLGTPGGSDPR